MANDQQQRTRPFSFRRRSLPADARERLAVQHERFGGINWGAAFFGWLSANGLAVILLAVVSAAGVAISLTASGDFSVNRERAENGLDGATPTIGSAETRLPTGISPRFRNGERSMASAARKPVPQPIT